ncbi:MAG: SurA N-terminal domain-containing protein [Bilophila wadsworthia]
MRIVSTAFLLFFLITSPVRAAINGVAAVVNGEMITAFDLQAETAPEAMRRGLNPKDPNQAAAIEELTKATLERMINNIILTQEAQRLKISVGDSEVDNEIQQIMSRNKMTPEEFQRQLQIQRTTEKDFRERIRSSILRNRLLANMVGRKVIVTKEEIADYYNQHKQTFMNNQKVRFAVIVYPPTENAEAQAARIRSGKLSFEQAARQVSVGPRAQEGGDVGVVDWNSLDPTWQDRLSQLKPGDVPDV